MKIAIAASFLVLLRPSLSADVDPRRGARAERRLRGLQAPVTSQAGRHHGGPPMTEPREGHASHLQGAPGLSERQAPRGAEGRPRPPPARGGSASAGGRPDLPEGPAPPPPHAPPHPAGGPSVPQPPPFPERPPRGGSASSGARASPMDFGACVRRHDFDPISCGAELEAIPDLILTMQASDQEFLAALLRMLYDAGERYMGEHEMAYIALERCEELLAPGEGDDACEVQLEALTEKVDAFSLRLGAIEGELESLMGGLSGSL